MPYQKKLTEPNKVVQMLNKHSEHLSTLCTLLEPHRTPHPVQKRCLQPFTPIPPLLYLALCRRRPGREGSRRLLLPPMPQEDPHSLQGPHLKEGVLSTGVKERGAG
jgi:hypothetical protein